MSARIEWVHVLREPGLYVIRSGSPSAYYVDSRGPGKPRYLRARGNGMSISSHMDNKWHDLVMLRLATDVNGKTVLSDVEWTLMVGAGHYFETRRYGHPNGDVYWVVSRDAWEIERLDAMPPPDDLTMPERGWGDENRPAR